MTGSPPRHRATSPEEAFWTLDPFALVVRDQSDAWHVDLEEIVGDEHYGVCSALRARFTASPARPDHVHIAVVGHKGTGKTTLVHSALARMPNVFAVFTDALQAFDQVDLSFADLLLVIARTAVSGLDAAQVAVDGSALQEVRKWFFDELLTETHRKELLGELESSASGGISVPLLAKLFAKVTAVFKTSNEYRHEIRRRAERDSADLVRRVNGLLDAADRSLRSAGAARLCVVLDNLEKLPDRSQVDAVVLRRADELRTLRASLVFFLDPSDEYAPKTTMASSAFDTLHVPSLPIRNRNDSLSVLQPAALDAIRELLDRRVALDRVFADVDSSVRLIARASGGRLRDILRIARRACEESKAAQVSTAHIERAIRYLATHDARAVRHFDRLAEIGRSKQVMNRPEDHDLLHHSAVLNYDGEPWWDVHPLLREDERFREADAKLTRVT